MNMLLSNKKVFKENNVGSKELKNKNDNAIIVKAIPSSCVLTTTGSVYELRSI